MTLKNHLVLLFLIGNFSWGVSQSDIYHFDKDNSTVAFTATHMGFLTVEGKFEDFSGEIVLDGENLVSVTCKISVASIDTADKTRDESLKGDGYLGAEKFPYIDFSSIELNINNLTGILKIKDVEKKISIPFEFSLSKDKREIQIKIITILKRKDFRLDFGQMDVLVGNDIKVELKLLGAKI